MYSTELHEDNFLLILWDEATRIIGIDWKESTATMTDEDMKGELMIFAGYVEDKKAPRILVDVTKFRYRMRTEVQEWRIRNISTRYNAAGVLRFAFIFPQNAPIPSTMNQSSPGEDFVTRAFGSRDEAIAWLTEEG